eukprot:TRINITY_DN9306_c0_g1_i10.p1 TRINITY_DN9306_c0_g1~~TRINITY_DN9306_c0_g1_i10.p1  ORF type:complete len:110 (-),score=5.79 TRINITY_DN9306_c0_g1_i10:48-377(-)
MQIDNLEEEEAVFIGKNKCNFIVTIPMPIPSKVIDNAPPLSKDVQSLEKNKATAEFRLGGEKSCTQLFESAADIDNSIPEIVQEEPCLLSDTSIPVSYTHLTLPTICSV